VNTLIDLCAGLPVRHFEKGETILTENQKDPRVFVLRKGVVEISKRGTLINRLSSPGSMLGEVATLLDQPRGASVVAVEPVEAYEIADGARHLAENPEMMARAARLLARRLRNLTEEVVEIREQLEILTENADEDDRIKVTSLESVLGLLIDRHFDREY
jgi:CRP/FNR family cyclic AMP-dependent transcriptional regulator